MKILLIDNYHYIKGGSETVYFNSARLLEQAGHEVIFFSRNRDLNLPYDKDSYFISDSKKHTKFINLQNYFYNSEVVSHLQMLINDEKPDIAHAHLMWGCMAPAIFKVLRNNHIPLIHTVHDYRMVCPAYTFRNGCGEVCEKCRDGKFIECFKGRCSKGSVVQSAIMAAEMYYRNKKWHPTKELDGIIYVSNFAKQKHEEFDGRFINILNTVLYNFTNVGETYSPIDEDGGYYLFYGRLSHEKGIATLIEVFARHPELKLKIVGTGPKEQELKQKKCSNVEFLGFKTGEELYNLVRKARFVCVPSEWYENNPMTIIEAYSMGVPVIGANIGGIPEIIEEERTGFLFESGEAESLEKAVQKSIAVSQDEYATMKLSALRFAKEHFDSAKYKERLVRFYEKVIKEYKG